MEVIGLLLALMVMLIGLVGSVLPVLPSTPIVAAAAIVHRLIFGEASVSNLVLGLIVCLMVLSLVIDYIAGMVGARKLGATWRGILGAIVGALVGLFFSLPGLLLGPFIGAALFEMMGGRNWKEATRAGLGAVLGVLAGAVGKVAACVAMIALFTVNVIVRILYDEPTGPLAVWIMGCMNSTSV